MSKKGIVTLALLAVGGYYLYQNRQDFKAGYKHAKDNITATRETYQGIQNNLAKIKDNLTLINHQKEVLTSLGQDLTYQLNVFQNDTQARLATINTVISKYQSR